MKSFESFITEELRKLSHSSLEEPEPKKLLNLKGEDFNTCYYGDNFIIGLMKNVSNEESRKYVLDLIDNTIGKKVVFYDIKNGRFIKKERISLGGYWKEDPNAFMGWQFMLKGTKKDYVVDMTNGIGYYDAPTKATPKETIKWYKGGKFEDDWETSENFNNDIDPYGEEKWEEPKYYSLEEYYEILKNINGIENINFYNRGMSYISFNISFNRMPGNFYVYQHENEDDDERNGTFLQFDDFNQTNEVKLEECNEEYFKKKLHYLRNEVINTARYRI